MKSWLQRQWWYVERPFPWVLVICALGSAAALVGIIIGVSQLIR